MKNNKANASMIGAILLVAVLLAVAVVVPWYVLSLVDTTPPTGEVGISFKSEGGSWYLAWTSLQIEFTDDVEIESMYAQLFWAEAPPDYPQEGRCDVYGQIQSGNAVPGSPIIKFNTVFYDAGEGRTKIYSAATTSGVAESLFAGNYYLALNVYCWYTPHQSDQWNWYEGTTVVTDPEGIVEVGQWCADYLQIGTFQSCYSDLPLFKIEGSAEEPPPPPGEDPEASFTWKADFANYRKIAFTDESVAPEGESIVSRAWDFGDSKTSGLQNPTHTYSRDGNYTVELTVTDSLGGNDTAETTLTIRGEAPPGDTGTSDEDVLIDTTDKDKDKPWGIPGLGGVGFIVAMLIATVIAIVWKREERVR